MSLQYVCTYVGQRDCRSGTRPKGDTGDGGSSGLAGQNYVRGVTFIYWGCHLVVKYLAV